MFPREPWEYYALTGLETATRGLAIVCYHKAHYSPFPGGTACIPLLWGLPRAISPITGAPQGSRPGYDLTYLLHWRNTPSIFPVSKWAAGRSLHCVVHKHILPGMTACGTVFFVLAPKALASAQLALPDALPCFQAKPFSCEHNPKLSGCWPPHSIVLLARPLS